MRLEKYWKEREKERRGHSHTRKRSHALSSFRRLNNIFPDLSA
jgi:hypothetical protein